MFILGATLGMFITCLMLFLYSYGFSKGKEEANKDDPPYT